MNGKKVGGQGSRVEGAQIGQVTELQGGPSSGSEAAENEQERLVMRLAGGECVGATGESLFAASDAREPARASVAPDVYGCEAVAAVVRCLPDYLRNLGNL